MKRILIRSSVLFFALLIILLAVVLFGSNTQATAYAATGESESNNTVATANTISVNTTISGNLSSSSDVDWYKFTISNNGYIDIEFNHILLSSGSNYWTITLYDETGVNVVVVFTKCDIPGIEEKIGESAVLQYRKQNKSTQFDAQNRVCEKFLLDYSEGNFLNSLKSKFKSVQFFTCSALGHKADGTRFTSNGVEVPALWIIDKVSTSINLQNLWRIKI